MEKLEEIRTLIGGLEKEKQEYFWKYFSKMPEKVLCKAKIEKVRKGKDFVLEGAKVDKIYILLKGRVEGMEYRVWKMEYGYFVFEPVKTFGTMEISLEQDIYQTTLKTLSECVFLVFSRKDFENWFWNDPAAVAAQLKEMGQYLYAQSSKERLRVLLSGKDRMSLFLIQNYESFAKNGEYLLPYSTSEFAYKIGVSERTITRARKTLLEEGCVKAAGKKLLVTKSGYEKMKKEIKNIMADL